MIGSGGAPDECSSGTYRVFQDGNPGASPSTEVAWIFVLPGTGGAFVEHWVLSADYAWMNPSDTSLATRIRVNPTQYATLSDFMADKWTAGCTYVVDTCVPGNWP